MPIPNDDEDEVFEYDPEAAENGWNATAPNRSAVGSASLPSVDMSSVAILGLRTARQLLRPEVRAPYEAQPAEYFDPAILDRLGPASWAIWYGDSRRRTLESTSSGGKLSVETLETATALKARMLRVAEYTLGAHPKAGREVAAIRAGRGFTDLGQDLTRLAALYESHRDIVSQGGLHYDVADADAAKSAAGQILFELGESQSKELTKAKDELAKAFAVFENDYDAVRRYAAAFWNDPDYFPSLYAVGRESGSTRSTSDPSPDAPAPVNGPRTDVEPDAS